MALWSGPGTLYGAVYFHSFSELAIKRTSEAKNVAKKDWILDCNWHRMCKKQHCSTHSIKLLCICIFKKSTTNGPVIMILKCFYAIFVFFYYAQWSDVELITLNNDNYGFILQGSKLTQSGECYSSYNRREIPKINIAL